MTETMAAVNATAGLVMNVSTGRAGSIGQKTTAASSLATPARTALREIIPDVLPIT